jgi:hypothetical protein
MRGNNYFNRATGGILMPIARVDPHSISTSLKEAVVDSLINTVSSRLAGADESGGVLYGSKPSDQLTSGFLVPLGQIDDDDEVTSPIKIGVHGLDFQIRADQEGLIRAKIEAAVYVRVLLKQHDLARRDCQFAFRLNRDVEQRRSEEYRRLRSEWWARERGTRTYFADHPAWNRVKDELQRAADAAVGIPVGVAHELGVVADEAIDAPGNEDGLGEFVDPNEIARLPDNLVRAMDLPHKWLRLPLECPVIEFDPTLSPEEVAATLREANEALARSIGEQLTAWAVSEDEDTGGRRWGFREHSQVLPSHREAWSQYLDGVRANGRGVSLPDIGLRWDISVRRDWLAVDKRNVHIAIENRSNPQGSSAFDNSVFQVSLQVSCSGRLHSPLLLGRVEPSYRYNQYLRYAALGLNSGVNASTNTTDAGDITLRTTWCPRYVQPRIRPGPQSTIELRIAQLAEPDGFDGIKNLAAELRAWTAARVAVTNSAEGLEVTDLEGAAREDAALQAHAIKWEEEARTIQAGVDLLEYSRSWWTKRGGGDKRAAVFEAWLAMNETMAIVAAEKDYKEWRLFQLAFILANMAALATRDSVFGERFFDERRDEAVTLLYFATGGGKSEAFLGLLCFSLFFDRLRGKHRGVTAMLRYPLRLLTIQQAQRTAKVLARAERVRSKWAYGGEPFEIGFWVGSTGSPNSLRHPEVRRFIPTISQFAAEAEEELVAAKPQYVGAKLRWRKLPQCPFCKSQTGLRRITDSKGPLAHVCSNPTCESKALGMRYLPFYIVDEDIYAIAPSVLLGTIDKLALIGHSPHTIRKILGMFGGALWQDRQSKRLYVPRRDQLRGGVDETEYERLAPGFADGSPIFHDPFPSLVVQDEAHLLEESLGTFAGLFETTLEAMLDELALTIPGVVAWAPGKVGQVRRRAKIVAASATVSRPERQLQHLYQRKIPAVQFPYPGPDLYESFYASPMEPVETERRALSKRAVETRSQQARVYAALLTNGRPHTTTMVAVLSEFHLTISRMLLRLLSDEGANHREAVAELIDHLSVGPLLGVHRAALERASVSEVATLIDLHRIALTYVTNKKGGDQILAAEHTEAGKRHLNAGIPLEGFRTALISGSVEQGQIAAAVGEAQRRPAPGEPFEPLKDSLRSIVATSAISHGVDIDELNTMFFAGLPSDIAEYIQASSRVGRAHVGFCLLVPTPQRRRDRYVVEVFDSFHRFLERMVQPAAIDRWAERAIKRAIPSIFQSYMCGVLPTVSILAAAPADKHQVPDDSFASDIAKRYTREGSALLRRLVHFGENAIGLREGFEPPGADYYRHLLEEAFQDLLNDVSAANVGTIPMSDYFGLSRNSLRKPMTSLRDVDRVGLIAYAPGAGHHANADELTAVMRLVQNGIVEGDDVETEGGDE